MSAPTMRKLLDSWKKFFSKDGSAVIAIRKMFNEEKTQKHTKSPKK
jgi:hypothetical protein